MEQRVSDIKQKKAPETLWLLEHPHCYTAGTSAAESDLLLANSIPVYETGRGGQYTYHGPGQRIGYVMLDLAARKIDIRDYVCRLEKWLIAVLADFGVHGELRDGRIGVWVKTEKGEDKIAALGVRVRHGVAYHGISLNIEPDLSYYSGIIPCGIREYGVTSFKKLGIDADKDKIDARLRHHFGAVFL